MLPQGMLIDKKKYPRYTGITRNAKEMAQTLAEITDQALQENLESVIDIIFK